MRFSDWREAVPALVKAFAPRWTAPWSRFADGGGPWDPWWRHESRTLFHSFPDPSSSNAAVVTVDLDLGEVSFGWEDVRRQEGSTVSSESLPDEWLVALRALPPAQLP